MPCSDIVKKEDTFGKTFRNGWHKGQSKRIPHDGGDGVKHRPGNGVSLQT